MLSVCYSSLCFYYTTLPIYPGIFPTGICLSPLNLPLIISVASPTSSHPLLFLYWHCYRHGPLPPSPHPSISFITSALIHPRRTFLSLTHTLHRLPTHPLVSLLEATKEGDLSQRPGCKHCHAHARTHTHIHTHTLAEYNQSDKDKQNLEAHLGECAWNNLLPLQYSF